MDLRRKLRGGQRSKDRSNGLILTATAVAGIKGQPRGTDGSSGRRLNKRGEKLKRKFESDLARRVTGLETSRPLRKTGLVLAAVAVCAMLSVSALYSVAIGENSGAPIVEVGIFSAEKAYLTETDTDDPLAVRTMNLKVKGDHLYAAEDCPLYYAKFVYRLDVSISDDEVAWEGMTLGELTLPGAVEEVTLVATATVTRGDTTFDVGAAAYAGSSGNVITVSIPALSDSTYAVGDSISISVMIQTGVVIDGDLMGETVYETAWGDSLTPTEVDRVIGVSP